MHFYEYALPVEHGKRERERERERERGGGGLSLEKKEKEKHSSIFSRCEQFALFNNLLTPT
jgi:hypothetical protein